MDQTLRLLILEDRAPDLTSTKRAVLRAFPAAMFTVASSESEFRERIDWMPFHIVLANDRLPGFSGVEALAYVRQYHPDLPFLFITDGDLLNLPDRKAILSIADGYVTKNKLEDLFVRITQAIKEHESRSAQRILREQADSKSRLLLQQAIIRLESDADFINQRDLLSILREAAGDTPGTGHRAKPESNMIFKRTPHSGPDGQVQGK